MPLKVIQVLLILSESIEAALLGSSGSTGKERKQMILSREAEREFPECSSFALKHEEYQAVLVYMWTMVQLAGWLL